MNEKKKIVDEKLSKLESEINELLRKIKVFRSNGDLTENADYNILSEELERLEEERFFLKEESSFLNFNKKDKVVTFEILDEEKIKKIRKVKLVEGIYADPNLGKISLNSPLGIALSDKIAGQIAKVIINKNLFYNVLITKIEEE